MTETQFQSVPAGASEDVAVRATRLLLWVLCASAAFPLYFTLPGGFTLRSPDLLSLSAAGTAFIAILRGQHHGFRRTPIDVPLAILWSLFLLSVFWSEDKGLYLRALRPWITSTIFFYLMIAFVRDARDARRVMGLLFLGLLAQASVGVWQLFAGREGMTLLLSGWGGKVFYEHDTITPLLETFRFNWNIATDDPLRELGLSITPSGTNLNATTFSVLMALLALQGLFSWSGNKLHRKLLAAASVLALLLALLSMKRSGWIALSSLIVFLPLFSKKVFWRATAIFAVAAAIVMATVLLHPKVGDRLMNRSLDAFHELKDTEKRANPEASSPTRNVDSAGQVAVAATGLDRSAPRTDHGRLSLWRYALERIAERPLLGHGLGQWPHHGPWTVVHRDTRRWGNTESTFLQFAVDLGVAGFAVFIWLIAVLFWISLRSVRRATEAQPLLAAGTGLLAIVIAATVNSLFPADQIWPLFYSFAAVIIWYDQEQSSTASTP